MWATTEKVVNYSKVAIKLSKNGFFFGDWEPLNDVSIVARY